MKTGPVRSRFVTHVHVADVRLIERLAATSTAPKRRQDLVVQQIVQVNGSAVTSREERAACGIARTQPMAFQDYSQHWNQRDQTSRCCGFRIVRFAGPHRSLNAHSVGQNVLPPEALNFSPPQPQKSSNRNHGSRRFGQVPAQALGRRFDRGDLGCRLSKLKS
jgi:hypothetical protein